MHTVLKMYYILRLRDDVLGNRTPLLNFMKKLLIFFIFFFFGILNAFSSDFEWEQVLKTNEGNIFFIDKNSINKKGDKIFFIKMHEYSDFNDYGEKSSIIHHEVDCKNLKFKYLTDFYFKLPMGEGEPSFVGNEESDWIEVKDNTILKVLVDYVCV